MSDDDRELLCAETARLVMGWTATDIPWAYDGATPVWHTSAGEPVMTVFSWRPDRNDAQSMQVLDRMVDLGFELTLTVRVARAPSCRLAGGRCRSHASRVPIGGLRCCAPRWQGPGAPAAELARKFHRFTAADADLTIFAALNAARVLDVLSSTPARPDSRSPCENIPSLRSKRKPDHLHALASRIGEIFGLARYFARHPPSTTRSWPLT